MSGPGGRSRPPVGELLIPVLLAATACADTVNPVMGGLRVGARQGAFHVPVMENERPPFRYPARAWREGVGGQTRLRIHITESGQVDSAYVLESSGHAALDSAALSGARALRYRPARQGDEPVAVWAVLPVKYPMPEMAEPDDREQEDEP